MCLIMMVQFLDLVFGSPLPEDVQPVSSLLLLFLKNVLIALVKSMRTFFRRRSNKLDTGWTSSGSGLPNTKSRY